MIQMFLDVIFHFVIYTVLPLLIVAPQFFFITKENRHKNTFSFGIKKNWVRQLPEVIRYPIF